jgi:hypothetical protein
MAQETIFTYVIYVSEKTPGLYRLRKTGVNPNTLKYMETQLKVSSNLGELRQYMRGLGRMRIGRGVNDHKSIIETWL